MKTNFFATCALLMFHGANFASADNQIKIDLFAPQNFLTKNLIQSLIQSLGDRSNEIGDAIGVAKFTQCPDDVNAFVLDTSSTRAEPSPLVKGSDVALKL